MNSMSTMSANAAMSGNNPFLDSLGPLIEYMDLARHLAYSPLKIFRVQDIPLGRREDLFATIKQHIVPTRVTQNIAAALQSLLREHYIQRNPMNVEVRKQVARLATYRDMTIATLPWFPNIASGAIIKGITGLGKSTMVNRYFSLLPQQVRIFGNGEIPGYQVLTQIVWMKVDMSADGSRGGFLLSILAEVDKLIGSDYHDQYARARLSIEKLMVRIGIILSTHFCGMLVVEEIQSDNFSESKHVKELATFFLRLLNFGIPVVLVGNPLGFEELRHHSQVMRRLTTGGSFHLHPCSSHDDFDWDLLVKVLWRFDVMPNSLPLTEEIRKRLFMLSGGIPDFLARLRVESQRLALRRRKDVISVEDIEKAFYAETIQENHNLILGFAMRDANRLAFCKDIPTEYYRNLWKGAEKDAGSSVQIERPKPSDAPVSDTQNGRANEPVPDLGVKPIVKAKMARYKSEATRASNHEKRVEELNATLPAEDMRQGGAKRALLDGMKALEARLNEKKQ